MLSARESKFKRRKSPLSLSEAESNLKVKQNESRRPSQTSEVVADVNHASAVFDNFKHIIYEKAALIYAYLKGEPGSSLPTFHDKRVKRRAYSLAFGAKKYESVLNDILLDSYFFSSYFKLESYYRNHVMVMLLDYQQNDFQFGVSRKSKDNNGNADDILPHIAEIQLALESFYIKLRASLARNRIRETALTVEDLLPSDEKEKTQYVGHQPIYAYVNSLTTNVEEVCNVLQESGFLRVENAFSCSEFSGQRFAVDAHLKDLIVFPRDIKFDVYNHDLVQTGYLVVQDKSRCLAPEVVRSVLFQLTMAKEKAVALIPGEIRPVFNNGDDVLIVNCDSVNLLARVSSFVHPQRSLFVCGVTANQYEELQSMLDLLGVQNITLVEENFLDILHNDDRFRKVRVILYNANCSKSGVMSPVDYVLQEGVACVHDLVNGVESNKLRGLVMKHHEVLKHAMKFYFVHYIVYFTNSIYRSENEDLIKKVTEENNAESASKNSSNPFGVVSFLPDLTDNLRKFRANSANVEDVSSQQGLEKYLKLNGQMGLNGGFVCLLQRRKLVDSANDVLERAAKKGLMKGTKRGKRSASTKDSKVPSEAAPIADKQLDVLAEQLESVVIETRDEKESEQELASQENRSKSGKKKKALQPFHF